MDSKQFKRVFSVVALLYALFISAAGNWLISYETELSFNMEWLFRCIFSTPLVAAITLIALLYKKK